MNLRGAGVNRTLVLLDGRRVVSSNRFGTVDVNMFPQALLKGIDTVTGGASASYGTDAVAGVVNFLLDTEFEGVKLNGQGGETTAATAATGRPASRPVTASARNSTCSRRSRRPIRVRSTRSVRWRNVAFSTRHRASRIRIRRVRSRS